MNEKIEELESELETLKGELSSVRGRLNAYHEPIQTLAEMVQILCVYGRASMTWEPIQKMDRLSLDLQDFLDSN